MAPHSSTLAWKIPWMEEPGRLQCMGSLRVGTTEQLHFHFSLSRIGEGNGNPLQYSWLENPRDRGAWWAAVCAVAQSWTRLTRLSSISKRVVVIPELLSKFQSFQHFKIEYNEVKISQTLKSVRTEIKISTFILSK